ncbi:MAG: hypothetical protein GY749_39565 [Desulfobacteraceae bacterium]|nr:hypothetical protein [Desulfobacteraceae bacterium]
MKIQITNNKLQIKSKFQIPILDIGIYFLVPTLCVGMQSGRSASGWKTGHRALENHRDAGRPGRIPTQSVTAIKLRRETL